MSLELTHLMQGSTPLTPTAYNTNTLQAMQWRKGEIALPAGTCPPDGRVGRRYFWGNPDSPLNLSSVGYILIAWDGTKSSFIPSN